MELRQLRYFVAVAEELHFHRAAERLHISQPPLSQQIRQLEEEMGCRLLARSRRRVELTTAGTAFLRDTRAILGELDAAVAAARRIEAGQTGRLRINFVGSALLSIVPGTVQRFRAARPGVEVELRERPTVDQVRRVHEGSVDLGLVRLPVEVPTDLRLRRVLREDTVAALPATHDLAREARVPLERLAGEPLVLFPRGQAPGFHDLLVRSLAGANVIQYAPEMQTIIGLVAAGIGVSFVPASVRRLSLDGVVYRPVDGAPDSELAAVSRADNESPLVAAFIEHAQE